MNLYSFKCFGSQIRGSFLVIVAASSVEEAEEIMRNSDSLDDRVPEDEKWEDPILLEDVTVNGGPGIIDLGGYFDF